MDGKLLYRGYVFSDTKSLDLYGEPATEDNCYEVTGATVAGTLFDLTEFLSHAQLADMGYWLDRHMQRDEMEGLIARAEQDRMLGQFDRRWRLR